MERKNEPSELLAGAVDLHIHTGPDIFPRLVTAISAAEAAQKAGMRAIIVKSHSTDTAARAATAAELTGFQVFGGVVLNLSVGGLNEYAVLETARQGGRIVWMPTITARHFVEKARFAPMLQSAIPEGVTGLTVTENGSLKPVMSRILALIAEHDLILATGHISPAESVLLVEQAIASGVRRVVVTHPHVPFVDMDVPTMKQLASMGAYIELTDHGTMAERASLIRSVGVNRSFLSTDGGTVEAPPPVERLAGYVQGLLDLGFRRDEVRYMSAALPAYLLGLDSTLSTPTA